MTEYLADNMLSRAFIAMFKKTRHIELDRKINLTNLQVSIYLIEDTQKRIEENQKRIEENQKRIEENQKRLEGSKKREGTRRLVKPHQGLIAPKYKPRPQTTTSRILSRALIMMQLVGLFCGATGNTDCLTTQSVLLGSQGIIRCRLFENSTRFYWFDMNIEGDESLLIKLENGRVSGRGYTTGEFNIDSDGSLIINSVTVQHERVFHFESLSPNLIRSKDITVIVYVEPIEPIPVITECLGKPDCIMKGNLDGVVSCVHHNTRPAATLSWFMRDGTHDIPLNSTTNQTLSADLITFSVTSEMVIGELPILANMQSLVLLVCKSHNQYSVVQESDSKVLLDLSKSDPFEKQPGPVYALQNQDLVIKCPLTIAEDSIVMWMAKSLGTRNSVYLKYSAYTVVPSVETDEQLSLDKSGDLVISQVGLQHDGLYACVKSTGNTTKSFLQRVEVIVQPTPPKVLVEGCNLFEPCSFHITETKAITCQVNGVYPEVDLEIIVLSTNLAVMNTKVSTYEDEGLFYTSIQGDLILVDASCQVNGTIICQAVGTAANVFKSDAYISISSS
ncbi:hypothetical protein BSL78_13778 [Apostichopus japonicus]|uniref:Immunoglobulin domain-containing protein n=1 Tax=Stichopus japonicus TaxID=307972 RepID=A0A2G8KN20_STIJA|nr:hypothetical protein BSL78_13778 [Apostichopus japonicus]